MMPVKVNVLGYKSSLANNLKEKIKAKKSEFFTNSDYIGLLSEV